MVGRPPDMRVLTEHRNCALAVLELQSAGARRSRVTNKSLIEGRYATKEPRTRSEQRTAVRTTRRPSSTTQISSADRRHRAASKGARNYVAPAKNKQEPPTNTRRSHQSTEKTGMCMSLKGCPSMVASSKGAKAADNQQSAPKGCARDGISTGLR